MDVQRTYDLNSGFLSTIQASHPGGSLQQLNYTPDDLLNMTARGDTSYDEAINAPRALSEAFVYDNLNRLTTATVGGTVVSTAFDLRGNITSKTGVGTYNYGTTSNRLLSIDNSGGGTTSFVHDANGNITGDGDRSLLYTVFNKPHTITRAQNTVTFSYGADRARFKRTLNGKTTWTVGSVEITEDEVDTSDPDNPVVQAYVFTRYIGDSTLVTVKKAGNVRTTDAVNYTVRDQLGSIDMVLDERGYAADGYAQTEHDLAFDAWGMRRSASDWVSPFDSGTSIAERLLALTPRGFTGHEMLDAVGLIHMNGRVYDPRIGRFFSADPFIQAPGNTQSYNRYSYVMNNPLAYADPSGYFLKELFKFVVAISNVVASDGFNPQAWIELALATEDLIDEFGSNDSDISLPGTLRGAFGNGSGGSPGIGRAGGCFTDTSTCNRRPRASGRIRSAVIDATIAGTNTLQTGGKFANGAATAAFASIVGEGASRVSRSGASPESNLPLSQRQAGARKAIGALAADGTINSGRVFTGEGAIDSAAKEVLGAVQPISDKYGLEIGGTIVESGEGYSYAQPYPGGSSGMSLDPFGAVAGYHTHPGGDYMSQFFSNRYNSPGGGDALWSTRFGKPLYMSHSYGGGTTFRVCNGGYPTCHVDFNQEQRMSTYGVDGEPVR